MPTVSPASDWAQRWRDGRHSWRHRSDGGFDSRHYEVAVIEETTAKDFVVAHHYSRSYPAVSRRYGLYERGALRGVMTLGTPIHPNVLPTAFPGLVPYRESLELNRLVLADDVPANGESWFVAHAFALAAAAGVRGVISHSDPVPRSVGGELLFPGHIGVIYQALNAIYLGRATARTLKLLPDGRTLNDRALQKVRKQERGHGHVEAKLVALGATPPAGDAPALWLGRALTEVGVTRARHGGNHRYAFALGRTPAERRRVLIAGQGGFYPKERDRVALAV